MQTFGIEEYKIKNSLLKLNLHKGGRIQLLVLEGVKIIQSSNDPLGSGSYVLYPWVNRLRQYHKHQFLDGNGLPIHGLYVANQRLIKNIHQSQNHIEIQIRSQKFDQDYPKFTQTFTFTENKLKVNFKLDNNGEVCFGYHPYLQINNTILSGCTFETNIHQQLELDQLMLPKYPFVTKITKVQPGKKYDTLFRGGSFFQITTAEKKTLKISSELPFWQIYTPDETRIAVEPMSYCGNAFELWKTEQRPQIQHGEWIIELN